MESPATEHEEMPIALGERLASNSPQDAGNEQSFVVDPELQPNQILKRYLQDNSPDFRRVDNLRQQGWKSEKADAHFKLQRRRADNATDEGARQFFLMMGRIGRELDKSTHALTLQTSNPTVLDMCMAPGGFLKTVMALNRSAKAMAFTLPRENGGHQVFISPSSGVCIDYLNITMMAKDMGFDVIPDDHADKNNFISERKIPAWKLFDLVLCDGQVLRTHTRANYREDREPRRLFTTQLVIGLEHLRPGGTMVVLLHMFDSWHTIQFLWTFQKFAQVQAFKPQTSHKKRSSFYMIAKNIQSRHPEAKRAVARWKSDWEIATFGNDEQFKSEVIMKDEIGVEEFLEEFGPAIVDMGAKVWRIQADALEKASWIKNA